ncbi:PTS transporter subunit EIIB [Cupriavidus necator]|uniref:hypothetical protein n=1 Tax=Cupriavidus necator TaxID=106590 RepID=UPI0039C28F30
MVDSCTTRLRLNVADIGAVSEPQLKALGARGVLKRAPNVVQVVLGAQAEQVAGEIRAVVQQGGAAATDEASTQAPTPTPFDPDWWIDTLGGPANIASVGVVAQTRLRVVVRERGRVRAERLDGGAGSQLMWTSDDTAHIAFGQPANGHAAAFQRALQAAAPA